MITLLTELKFAVRGGKIANASSTDPVSPDVERLLVADAQLELRRARPKAVDATVHGRVTADGRVSWRMEMMDHSSADLTALPWQDIINAISNGID